MIQSKLHSVSGVLCHSALGVRDLTAGLHKMISKALYQVRKRWNYLVMLPTSRLFSVQRCVKLLDFHSVWILSCGFCSRAYIVIKFYNIQLSSERSALCPGPSQVSAQRQRQRPERDALSSVPVCLLFFLFVFNSASLASNFVQQLEDECSPQRFGYFHPN